MIVSPEQTEKKELFEEMLVADDSEDATIGAVTKAERQSSRKQRNGEKSPRRSDFRCVQASA